MIALEQSAKSAETAFVRAIGVLTKQLRRQIEKTPSANVEYLNVSRCEDGETIMIYLELTNGLTLTSSFVDCSARGKHLAQYRKQAGFACGFVIGLYGGLH